MATLRASSSPAALLRTGESAPPPAVDRVAAFLDQRGVWFSLSRNPPVRSCRDAAHHRYRLGHEGVPLWDELKSYFGRIESGPSAGKFVMIHCRGDRRLDLDLVAQELEAGEPPTRVSSDEIENLGMAYGLVHPFVPWALDGQLLTSPILQVFDEDLLVPIGVPGTVTTNAGDLTWGVELDVRQLAKVIDHKRVARVAVPDEDEPPRPRWTEEPPVIGIITGNSPESGMALWQHVNKHVRAAMGSANVGDVSMPRVLVDSLPHMGLSMELPARHDLVWAAIHASLDRMLAAGAKTIALACNTTQYFGDRIAAVASEHGARFISMPDAVADWLRAHDVHQIALVGIESVSDLGDWSAYREPMSDVTVEVPRPEAMQRIDRIAYKVKQEGPTDGALNHLRDILRQEVTVDHVVLALTELSLLADRRGRTKQSAQVLIDSLAVYAEAIVSAALDGR